MPEKILVLDNSTFFVICHAVAEDEKGIRNAQNLYWFLSDGKNAANQEILSDHTCETIVQDADWIEKQAEKKNLEHQCRQNSNTHTETVCFLSSDVTALLKRNSFAKHEYMRYTRQHEGYIRPEKEMIQNA